MDAKQTQGGITMQAQLRIGLDNPLVREHRVLNQHLLPGLAYIDLLFQIFRSHGHDFRSLELCNLSIYQPLVVSGAQSVLLDVQCTQDVAGRWRVVVEGRSEYGGALSQESKRYATAEMRQVEPARFDESIDMPGVMQTATHVLTAEEMYAGFRQAELVHDEFMRVEGKVVITQDGSYVACRVSDAAAESCEQTMFHPALIDGSALCGACALFMAEPAGEQQLALPLFYESFHACELMQAGCITRIRRASVRRVQELNYFTMEFFNDAGRKVAELRNFAGKLVRDPGLIDPARAGSSPPPQIASVPAAAPAAAPAATSAASTVVSTGAERFLRELLAAKLGRSAEEIDPAAGYYELGINSASLLELVQAIESRIGATLSPTLLFEYVTVAQLAAHLSQHYADRLGEEARGLGERPGESLNEPRSAPGTTAVVPHSAATHPRTSETAAAAADTRSQVAAGKAANLPSEQTAATAATAVPARTPATSATTPAVTGDPIAIIGMAGRFPAARNVRELWENLKAGRDCISEIPASRWDWRRFEALRSPSGKPLSRWGGFVDEVDCFDPQFFRISPREADSLDPQERLFLETCWETIEDAGYTLDTLGTAASRSVGVFAGLMHKDYALLANESQAAGLPVSVAPSSAAIANRVSYCCNFSGPSIVIDTVCSSSLIAVHLAVQSLRAGECTAALAGGVNLTLHPSKYLAYGMMDMFSSTGRCHTFGAGGDGYVSSEAVGAVLLKPLACAARDGDNIYAVIRSTGTNHVGAVSGFTVPSPAAQSELIAACLEKAGVDARSISYVEAHGTGTSLGDPIEIAGLTKAFSRSTQDTKFCAIGSIKSNIGHAESAAGVCGLIKVALQLQHRMLVPSLHSRERNPHIDWEHSPFFVQNELQPWPTSTISQDGREVAVPRRAALSSFGATGSNAHLILEEYVGQPPALPSADTSDPKQCIVPLSARSEERLREYAARLKAFLETSEPSDGLTLENIAFTLQVGRKEMDTRVAFVAESVPALVAKLASFAEGNTNIAGCYFRKATDRDSASLAADEDFAALLQTWVQKQKLSKIAQMWVAGSTIDWTLLRATGRAPRRISLPTYPFARERYWIETASAGKGQPAAVAAAVLHPLVQRNTSRLGEQRFTSTLSGEEFYLADHVVNGQRVLPGVAYLEMARAALLQSMGLQSGAVELRDIVWMRPLTVQGPREVHIALYAEENGDVEFEVYTEGTAEDVTIHAQGRAVLVEQATETVGLPGLRSLCDASITAEQCYAAFAAMGIAYGAAHRGLSELHLGKDADGERFVLGQIQLPACVSDTHDQYVLHPSVLDSALQAGLGMSLEELLGSTSGGTVLPFALERLQVLERCPRNTTVWVRRSASESGAGIQKLDLDVCDESGRVCVRLQGFTSRVIEGVARDLKQTVLLVPGWQAKPAVGATGAGTARSGTAAVGTAGAGTAAADTAAVGTAAVGTAGATGSAGDDAQRWVWIDSLYKAQLAPLQAANPGVQWALLPEGPDGSNTAGPVLKAPDGSNTGASVMAAAEALFSQVQQIVQGKPKQPVLLQVVLAAQAGNLQGALGGLLKTAQQENPKVIGQLLELPPDASVEQLLSAVEENASVGARTDSEIRYTNGQREVAQLKELTASAAAPLSASTAASASTSTSTASPSPSTSPTTFAATATATSAPTSAATPSFRSDAPSTSAPNAASIAPEHPLPWKDAGVYLITGGAGGLGLIFAREIAARTRGATLILTGRSELNAEKQTQLQQLRDEFAGTRIDYQVLDVADAAAVNRCVQAIVKTHGTLTGVIHSAGVIHDNFILKKSVQELQRVMAAKVAGTINLDEATQDVPLEWMILFSSIAGAFGGVGQCDYAMANAFMDRYARYRTQLTEQGKRHGRTLSINWPLWESGGMQMGEQTQLAMRRQGLDSLSTADGIEALYRAWRSDAPQVVVLSIAPQAAAAAARSTPQPRADTHAQSPSASLSISPAASVNRDELRGKTVQYLKGLLSDALKLPVDRIEADAGLDLYGIDSIVALKIVGELEASLGSLPKTLLFEYQSISAVTGYLLEHHRDGLAARLGATASGKPTAVTGTPQAIETPPAVEQEKLRAARNLTRARRRTAVTSSRSAPENQSMRDSASGIAIIGISGRYPGAHSVDEYWENLKSGKDCITEVPPERWDHSQFYDPEKGKRGKTACKWGGFIEGVDTFDHTFFNLSAQEASLLDPQERILLETAWHLMESAGYTSHHLHARHQGKVGVYVGGHSFVQAGASMGLAASRISGMLKLFGPSFVVDTFSASSITALHLACEGLASGDSQLAIVAGVCVLHPEVLIGSDRWLTTREDRRGFSTGGGMIFSEGAGAVLLKPLQAAQRDSDRILAVIRATAVDNEGKPKGGMPSDPAQLSTVIRRCLEKAEVHPRTIGCVEAAVNGNSAADFSEVLSYTKVFREQTADTGFCVMGTPESIIGHSIAASGMAQLTKAVMQLSTATFVPSIKMDPVNPDLALESSPFVVLRSVKDWPAQALPRRALLTSRGADGTQASVLLEEYREPVEAERPGNSSPDRDRLFLLSAHTEGQLRLVARQLIERIERGPDIDLADLAYTLNLRRESMAHRAAIVARTSDELLRHLYACSEGQDRKERGGPAAQDRVFCGVVGPGRRPVRELLSEEQEKSLITQCLLDNDLQKLARYWVMGSDIQQALRESKPAGRLLSLPPYPFAALPLSSLGKMTQQQYREVRKFHEMLSEAAQTLTEVEA
jgi:acyl transferase domain-containing protein/acyl carrier protein